MSSREAFPQFTFRQLSPQSQNSVFPPSKEVLTTFQTQLQKVSKENMPFSQPLVAGKPQASLSAPVRSSHAPAKRRKLQPYILITTPHSASSSKKHASPSRHAQISNAPDSQGPDVLAAALFKQFSHNTAPRIASKKFPTLGVQQDSLSSPKSSVPRKRTFSAATHDSTPDELLLAPKPGARFFVAKTEPGMGETGSYDSAGPVTSALTAEVPSSKNDVPCADEPDQQAVGRPHESEIGSLEAVHAQPDTPVPAPGPPLHVYACGPPVQRSAYYRRREMSILEEALKSGEEKAKKNATRYNPPPHWHALSRVPGRPPHITRSETRAQRYTALLEQLYGPGDVRRGNGRKPYKMRSGVEMSAVHTSDVEEEDDDDDDEGSDEEGEDSRSDTSTSALPITPPDPIVFSADSATLLRTTTISSPRESPYPGGESVHVPVKTSETFDSLKPSHFGVEPSSAASESDPGPSMALPVLDVMIPEPVPVIPMECNTPASDSPATPVGPVHQIRWHNPEEWKKVLRRLVAGKNQIGIADVMQINDTIMSLEELIQALPGEEVIATAVAGVAEYLVQIKDLPVGYIPFDDHFKLRKRAAGVLRTAYGEGRMSSVLT